MKATTMFVVVTSVVAATPVSAQIEHMRQTIFGMD